MESQIKNSVEPDSGLVYNEPRFSQKAEDRRSWLVRTVQIR